MIKSLTKSMVCLLLLLIVSCEKGSNVGGYLDSVDSDKYYSEEIIPDEYLNIYGKWKLYDVSGGIHGTGHEPDYDYLVIKRFGIYGLIRKDTLFEYGRMERFTFDNNTFDLLQVKLIPDYRSGQYYGFYPPEKYIELIGVDSLNLISPCCDLYNYHYKRIH